ncbi:MAG: OmpA family protein [Cytophagales bacterium]|nr:OmpA family protein [Cytophagales bacterium]
MKYLNAILLMATLSVSSQNFEGESVLVHSLNSPYGEDFIALHPSGKEMAFARLNHPYNQGGNSDAGDIWRSQLDSGWSTPVNWHELNTENFSSPIGYTSDGSAMIYNKVSTSGGALTSELWVYSHGQTKKLDIKYFKNKSTHQSGCLSADNRYLIISMESGATRGVEDLYILIRNGDSWSAPKNLGPKINTAFQEISPFLSADNRTLYFATNGREGEGSFDIFSSERLGDGWRNWSTPKNLGSSVNTQGRETSFAFEPEAEYAYFVSIQHSDGYGDIRRVKFSLDSIIQAPLADTTKLIEVTEITSLDGIRFVNAKNSEPIIDEVILTTNGSVVNYFPDENGIIPVNSEGTAEVEIGGYFPIHVQYYADSLVVARMEPLEVGRTIQLEHVLFRRGTADIISSSFEELDVVVKMMKHNPEIKILLKGHTDGNGDMLQNKKLSEARVQEVRRYISTKGINKKRIDGIGVGGEEPIASNETEATRKLNRRVEFEIVE